MERRLARAREPRREAIKGTEEEAVIQKPWKKTAGGKVKEKEEKRTTLNNF